jgi:hypothetical protein
VSLEGDDASGETVVSTIRVLEGFYVLAADDSRSSICQLHGLLSTIVLVVLMLASRRVCVCVIRQPHSQAIGM